MPKNTLSALDIFDPSSYPTRRDEDWKYSDLSRALREAPRSARLSDVADELHGLISGFTTFTVERGDYYDLQEKVEAANGRLHLLHNFIAGRRLDGYQDQGSITVAENGNLILVEEYCGAEAFADHTELQFTLGRGASLTRVVILDEDEKAISIRRSTVATAPGATFKQFVFSTGARFQRFETHVDHAGHGASVELHGAYLLKDKAHFDLTTRVNHTQPDGVTQQLIKGLVKDQATAVFQGRIKVMRGADGTDARMRHQALMLNDGAHVRAKPELEIYADDVQCAHGNTIGAMDEAALFFCQSRGMPEATARQLLMQAFITPVADQIENEELRATVLKFLEDKSGGFYAV